MKANTEIRTNGATSMQVADDARDIACRDAVLSFSCVFQGPGQCKQKLGKEVLRLSEGRNQSQQRRCHRCKLVSCSRPLSQCLHASKATWSDVMARGATCYRQDFGWGERVPAWLMSQWHQ